MNKLEKFYQIFRRNPNYVSLGEDAVSGYHSSTVGETFINKKSKMKVTFVYSSPYDTDVYSDSDPRAISVIEISLGNFFIAIHEEDVHSIAKNEIILKTPNAISIFF